MHKKSQDLDRIYSFIYVIHTACT
uniref:Uncharacterized protein n=1 Tax=Anguilla anguilla TaxID=7936 RepID=A0A0E9TTQ1_ANGAN